MSEAYYLDAVQTLSRSGVNLRGRWRLDWPDWVQQAVQRLRFDSIACTAFSGSSLVDPEFTPGASAEPARTEGGIRGAEGAGGQPVLVALVGGASSGKSTMFNNLLGHRNASAIAARAHTTLGPILAIHEEHREAAGQWISQGELLPDWEHAEASLDEESYGKPGTVVRMFHTIEVLRGVLLFDMPDFTSEAARLEGDVCLTLLPWFDRIVIVVDYERVFDRESTLVLRGESERLGQERFVLFNETQEGRLPEDAHDALSSQAQRLGAVGFGVLPFRRGRGPRRFAPGTLDPLLSFLTAHRRDRWKALMGAVSSVCGDVLNQNDERAARFEELCRAVDRVVESAMPSRSACLVGLMTPKERGHLDVVTRVLGAADPRQWLATGARRLKAAARSVPVFGSLMSVGRGDDQRGVSAGSDRRRVGEAFFQATLRRAVHDVERTVGAGAFWDEVRRWTGLEPKWQEGITLDPPPVYVQAVEKLDRALSEWIAKAESECAGLRPHVKGAIGIGVIAIVLTLVAVEGPVALLTVASAKTALAGALGKIGLAGGAGALLGKPLARLGDVAWEKLIGSKEFEAVQSAAESARLALAASVRAAATGAIQEAQAFVLAEGEPARGALEMLSSFREQES